MNTVLSEKKKSLKFAILLSGFLTLLKGITGFFCSSTVLLASALDSLMDVGLSSVNFFSIKKGAQPPDKEHAYGHEKIESLASYTQGIIFLFMAFTILGEAIRRVSKHNEVTHSTVALVVIVIAVLTNFLITAILARTERKTKSLVVKAERTHYTMDILSYALIFIVIFLVRWTGWSGWDMIGGVLFASYIAVLAAQILIQSGNELIDHSLPKRVLDQLDFMIREHDPLILGYHQMRTRKVGDKNFVDFHLVMKSRHSFSAVHEVTESLITKIKNFVGNVDVTIHEDPEHEH